MCNLFDRARIHGHGFQIHSGRNVGHRALGLRPKRSAFPALGEKLVEISLESPPTVRTGMHRYAVPPLVLLGFDACSGCVGRLSGTRRAFWQTGVMRTARNWTG